MDIFIDEKKCKQMTSLSRVTRWRLERAGEFPKRVQISPGRIAWRISEIIDWIENPQPAVEVVRDSGGSRDE